jgi:ribonuclease P protein subunit POP4
MNVFSIVTTANKVKSKWVSKKWAGCLLIVGALEIPKAGSIFLLTTTACKETFTLYGSQLQFRAAERAAKKFKIKPTIDL